MGCYPPPYHISEKQKEFNPRNFRAKKKTTISGTHTHKHTHTTSNFWVRLTTVQSELQPGKGREWAEWVAVRIGSKKAFEILHLPYNGIWLLHPSQSLVPAFLVVDESWTGWEPTCTHSSTPPIQVKWIITEGECLFPKQPKTIAWHWQQTWESEVIGALIRFIPIPFLKFHETVTNQSLIFIPPSIIITGE